MPRGQWEPPKPGEEQSEGFTPPRPQLASAPAAPCPPKHALTTLSLKHPRSQCTLCPPHPPLTPTHLWRVAQLPGHVVDVLGAGKVVAVEGREAVPGRGRMGVGLLGYDRAVPAYQHGRVFVREWAYVDECIYVSKSVRVHWRVGVHGRVSTCVFCPARPHRPVKDVVSVSWPACRTNVRTCWALASGPSVQSSGFHASNTVPWAANPQPQTLRSLGPVLCPLT